MFVIPGETHRTDYVFLDDEGLPNVALFSCGSLVNTTAKSGPIWRTASTATPEGGYIHFDVGKGRIIGLNVSTLLRKYFFNELLQYTEQEIRPLEFMDASRYSVTCDGQLWSWKEYRFLNPNLDRRGYPRTALLLDTDKRRKMFRIHQLVARAFIPNPDNCREVNHKDGVKTNNHVSNLEWVTPAQNFQHAKETGLLKRKYERFVATEEQAHAACKLLESGLPIRQVAKKLDMPYEGVRRLRVNQHAHIFQQYDIQIGKPGRPKRVG